MTISRNSELMQGGLSVQLGSNNPFGRLRDDQTIEETPNKDTQALGGPRGPFETRGCEHILPEKNVSPAGATRTPSTCH